jgi:hypothetical protein
MAGRDAASDWISRGGAGASGGGGWGLAGDGGGGEGRPSFLKKRSKKHLSIWCVPGERPGSNGEKFFASFFQKRSACFILS